MSRTPHLTFHDRLIIERSLSLNLPIKAIANNLERSVNGISEEVRKNGGITEYTATKAQELADLGKKKTIEGRKKAYEMRKDKFMEFKIELQNLLDLHHRAIIVKGDVCEKRFEMHLKRFLIKWGDE